MTELKRASVSGPISSHINQRRCEGELEGRDGPGRGGGAEVNGGAVDGGRGGMKSLHTQATCCHLPFSAWLPPSFHLLFCFVFFWGLQTDTLAGVMETRWRHIGTPRRPWHRLLCRHLSVPNCSLSLSLSSIHPPVLPPLLSPPLLPALCHLPFCQPPDSVVIINTPSS